MNRRNGSVLSVDIGGSTCKIGRVTGKGKVQDVQRQPTREIREHGPDRLIEYLEPYEEDYPIDGVAIGIPATVDWDHNHVRSSCPEVPWLEDASNKKRIQDSLGRPLLLVNDVEALMVGEWRRGELKGLNSGVVLSLGESMGSALLWNGVPQQGRRGSIMELEHVSLDTYGEVVGENPPGSSSNWLSGSGLRRQMEKQGEAVPLEEFFGREEDPYAGLRSTFTDKMAHLLGLIVMMLDPERIVLGGGLTLSHRRWLPDVKERMDDYVMEQFQGVPSVVLGQLRGDEVLRGPAAFWDWKVEEEH